MSFTCPKCGASFSSRDILRRHIFQHLWEPETPFPPDWLPPEAPPPDDDDEVEVPPPEDWDEAAARAATDPFDSPIDKALFAAAGDREMPDSEDTRTGEEALVWEGDNPADLAGERSRASADRGLGVATGYAPPAIWGPWTKSPSAHFGSIKTRVSYKQFQMGPLVLGQVKWINKAGKWVTKSFRDSVVIETGNYTGYVHVRLTATPAGVGCRITF